MNTNFKKVLIITVFFSMVFSVFAYHGIAPVYAEETINARVADFKIKYFCVDYKPFMPVLEYGGRSYLPLREISALIGSPLFWTKVNGKDAVLVDTAYSTIVSSMNPISGVDNTKHRQMIDATFKETENALISYLSSEQTYEPGTILPAKKVWYPVYKEWFYINKEKGDVKVCPRYNFSCIPNVYKMKLEPIVPTTTAPFLNVLDRTYMPIREISSVYGIEIDWDGSTRTIYIGGMCPTTSNPTVAKSKGPFTDTFYFGSPNRFEYSRLVLGRFNEEGYFFDNQKSDVAIKEAWQWLNVKLQYENRDNIFNIRATAYPIFSPGIKQSVEIIESKNIKIRPYLDSQAIEFSLLVKSLIPRSSSWYNIISDKELALSNIMSAAIDAFNLTLKDEYYFCELGPSYCLFTDTYRGHGISYNPLAYSDALEYKLHRVHSSYVIGDPQTDNKYGAYTYQYSKNPDNVKPKLTATSLVLYHDMFFIMKTSSQARNTFDINIVFPKFRIREDLAYEYKSPFMSSFEPVGTRVEEMDKWGHPIMYVKDITNYAGIRINFLTCDKTQLKCTKKF